MKLPSITLTFFSAAIALASSTALAQTQPTTRVIAQFNGTNGANPVSQLILLPNGELLGVSISAQYYPKAPSSIYLVTRAGAIQPIYQLASDGSQGSYFGNAFFDNGLLQASDGNIYGLMTFDGKTGEGPGFLYRFSFPSTFTRLHEFSYDPSDCGNPQGSLVQGINGYLYGICSEGGTSSAGAIFRVGLDGSYNKIYDFGQDDIGVLPYYGLAAGPNGMIYGVTNESYPAGIPTTGPVFELNPVTSSVSVFANSGNGYLSLPAFDANGDLELLEGSRCPGCTAQLTRYSADGSGPVVEYSILSSQEPKGAAELSEPAPGIFLIANNTPAVIDLRQGSLILIRRLSRAGTNTRGLLSLVCLTGPDGLDNRKQLRWGDFGKHRRRERSLCG